MNKTTRISIGKTPYEIELDAEKSLTQYMTALKKALEADGSSETMADIELHITEILAEQKVKPGGVITASDVTAIKEQLGDPAQFADSREIPEKSAARKQSHRWLLGAGVVILLIASVSAFMWRDRIWQQNPTTLTETQTYERKIASLEVVIESGSLDVRLSPDGKILVERELKWADTKPTYSERWSGEQLHIDADCPENENNCSVDYIVYVPKDITLRAQTQAGSVNVAGIGGNVHLTTSAGNIDVTDLAGSFSARTSDGTITGARLTSSDVAVQTSSGNIDLSFLAAPTKVVAKAASGHIDVNVPVGEAYAVRAETSSGERTVLVPQNSASTRHIDAETSAGNVMINGQ